jgi:hypothetical protein
VDEMDFESLMEWVNGLSSMYSHMCRPAQLKMEVEMDDHHGDVVSLMDARACIGNLISKITTQISSIQSEGDAQTLDRIGKGFSDAKIKWSLFMKERDDIMDECVLALLMLCAKTSRFEIIRQVYEEMIPVHGHSYWMHPSYFSSLSVSLMLFFGMMDEDCCLTLFESAVKRIVEFHDEEHRSTMIVQYSAALISLLQRKGLQVNGELHHALVSQILTVLHPLLIQEMENISSEELESRQSECIQWLWLHVLMHVEGKEKEVVSSTCEWMQTTTWTPATILSFRVWDALFASKATSSKTRRWWLQHRLHMWVGVEEEQNQKEHADDIANAIMQSVVRDCLNSDKTLKRFVKLSLKEEVEVKHFVQKIVGTRRISTDAALVFLKEFTSVKALRGDDSIWGVLLSEIFKSGPLQNLLKITEEMDTEEIEMHTPTTCHANAASGPTLMQQVFECAAMAPIVSSFDPTSHLNLALPTSLVTSKRCILLEILCDCLKRVSHIPDKTPLELCMFLKEQYHATMEKDDQYLLQCLHVLESRFHTPMSSALYSFGLSAPRVEMEPVVDEDVPPIDWMHDELSLQKALASVRNFPMNVKFDDFEHVHMENGTDVYDPRYIFRLILWTFSVKSYDPKRLLDGGLISFVTAGIASPNKTMRKCAFEILARLHYRLEVCTPSYPFLLPH